jgi:hypothetical protein
MNSSFIDVVIGLMLVYLVFSTASMVMTEWWSRFNSARPRQLKKYIAIMLDDNNWSENYFYKHPLITALSTEELHIGRGTAELRLPSYIPERIFALTLMDLAFIEEDNHQLKVRTDVPEKLQEVLRALTTCTRNSCQHTQDRLERWFTESMGRLSGRYTRYAHTIVMIFSIIITIGVNVDTLLLARTFTLNPAHTQAAVSMASQLSQQSSDPKAMFQKLGPSFQKLNLPLGYPDADWPPTSWPLYLIGKAVGWLLTICALSLGAPFWFDVLSNVMNIRQAGPKNAAS